MEHRRFSDRGDGLGARLVGRIRAFYRRVGANVLEAYLAQSAAAMVAYSAYFALVDARALWSLIALAGVAVAIFWGAIRLVRTGRTLVAAMLSQFVPTGVAVAFSAALSQDAGVHLILLLGASSSFAVFDSRRVGVRRLVVILNVLLFVAIELFATRERALIQMDVGAADVLFTLNAIAVAVLLYFLASVVHAREERAQTVAELAAEHASVLARTDALTGLANRRPALERLDQVVRDHDDYSLAIVDFDHFKALNDEFGHACGDRVLVTIGHEIARNVRAEDMVARWGGEEFLILLPATTAGDARQLMERLREEVDKVDVYCPDHLHHITVSIGVGGGDAHPGEALKRADAALYAAKQAGRNIVRVSARTDPDR